MAINPNFTRSIANSYRKASFQNKLTEKLEERSEKADNYFSNMFDVARTKGLPAYEEANARSKDLKRISRLLRDRYDLTDAQILGLAQRPSGRYGAGLSGIEKAITEADLAGRPLTGDEILSVFETAEQIQLPEGMTFEDGIAKLAGIYTDKAAQDPESKDEKNIFTNLLSSALVLNPKINATNMLENSNIGGISASDLYAQSTTLPSTNLFDVDFSDRTLGRRSDTEDERMRKTYFKNFLASVKGVGDFQEATSSFTSASAEQAVYAAFPEVIFQLETVQGMNQFEAINYVKENITKLTSGENPESIDQIKKRMNLVASGENINALEDETLVIEKPSIQEYNIEIFSEDGTYVDDLKITKAEQNFLKSEGKDLTQVTLDLIKMIETLTKLRKDKLAEVMKYLEQSILDNLDANAKYTILQQALKIANST